MAPIRIGIIGLAARKGEMAPGTWAYTAHLPAFLSSPAYEVVALCNTSEESARRAIEFHNLPSTTRAYGSAEQLATDPDVDMIVVSVVVMKHLELALPALQNKKNVFVEWPLGASLEESEQLTQLANENGVTALVGTQGRADAITLKIKQIIASGEIGDVRSTCVVGSYPNFFAGSWFEGAEYYLDMANGGNPFTITFGHFLDSFIHVLGDFDIDNLSALLKNDISKVAYMSSDFTKVLDPAYPKNTPDHILVQGLLESGATASITFRNSGSAAQDESFRWIITGSKGEIEVIKGGGQWQMHNAKWSLTLRQGNEVKKVELSRPEASTTATVSDAGLNTALLWDAYAKGEKDAITDFESALKTHRLLDIIMKKSGFSY